MENDCECPVYNKLLNSNIEDIILPICPMISRCVEIGCAQNCILIANYRKLQAIKFMKNELDNNLSMS